MSNDRRTTTRPGAHRRMTVLAVLATTGLVLAACGEQTSVDNADETEVSASSVPDTQPATTPADTTPVTEPATTPAPEPPTTPETAPPTTAAPVEPPALLTAIDGAGDAVVVEAGVPTVVYDGSDPDDAAPEEGESVSIDSVAVAPDGRVIVSLCCEPVAGSLLTVDRATGAEEYSGFGHLATFGSTGTMFWTAYDAIDAGGADGMVSFMIAPHDPTTGTVIDLAVVPGDASEGDVLLVLIAGPDGTTLHRHTASGGEMSVKMPVSDSIWTDAELPSLAGHQGDAFYVLDEATDRLLAFEYATLEPVAVGLDPAGMDTFPWTSAWITPEGGVYVTDDRGLFVVGGGQIPGEYVWAR